MSDDLPANRRTDDLTPGIQVHQYIQLVNQSDSFPDPRILNGYDEATRKWVLERVEIEQDARHQFVNKLADQDHQQQMTRLTENGKNQRHSQLMGFAMLFICITPFSILLYANKPVAAFVSLIPVLGIAIAGMLYRPKQHARKGTGDPEEH
jgi:hypothetical protein